MCDVYVVRVWCVCVCVVCVCGEGVVCVCVCVWCVCGVCMLHVFVYVGAYVYVCVCSCVCLCTLYVQLCGCLKLSNVPKPCMMGVLFMSFSEMLVRCLCTLIQIPTLKCTRFMSRLAWISQTPTARARHTRQ